MNSNEQPIIRFMHDLPVLCDIKKLTFKDILEKLPAKPSQQYDLSMYYKRIDELTDYNDPQSVDINVEFKNGLISYIEARIRQDNLLEKKKE